MTINENEYCQVDRSGADEVVQGPRKLRQNEQDIAGKWWDNVWTVETWPDSRLADDIQFWPYRLIDAGAPADGKSYNRTLGDFVITATEVTRTAIYTEWTQEEYDTRAAVTPIDWTTIPKEQRQFVDVPYQQQDRLVINRIMQTWNQPDDVYGLSATLYAIEDATGMSVKIHDDNGTFLYTMPLVETSPGSGVWYAETQPGSWGQHLERKAWKYYIFKGLDITDLMQLPLAWERAVHNIKWNVPDPATLSARGMSIPNSSGADAAPERIFWNTDIDRLCFKTPGGNIIKFDMSLL